MQEVQPRGFYLRNERGDLVYVPDYPYEQFEQLLKIQRNLANPQRPAFVMRDMAIDAGWPGIGWRWTSSSIWRAGSWRG